MDKNMLKNGDPEDKIPRGNDGKIKKLHQIKKLRPPCHLFYRSPVLFGILRFNGRLPARRGIRGYFARLFDLAGIER